MLSAILNLTVNTAANLTKVYAKNVLKETIYITTSVLTPVLLKLIWTEEPAKTVLLLANPALMV